MNTFIDRAQSGGRMNERRTEALVERIELDGETWIGNKAVPVHVGLIRATYADARAGDPCGLHRHERWRAA